MTDTTTHGPEPAHERPLESWKEIAAYLKRGVRTVKRWEQWEGLPVRRHVHALRASVYAYPSELEAWRATRRPAEAPDDAPRPPRSPRPLRAAAVTVTLLLALLPTGDSPLIGRADATSSSTGQDVVARRVWAGTDLDVTGSFSPDGRLITFVDWTTGDLVARDLVDGRLRNLTRKAWNGSWADHPEQALWSVVSWDGTRVAYAWQPQGTNYELRVVGTEDGATSRVVYGSPDVALVQPMDWSRDGASILAVLTRDRKTTNQIAIVSAAGGSVRVLKSLDWRRPGAMALSPDGRNVAYDFGGDIFVLAVDGSRETALVQHASQDSHPMWTKKGDRVVFVSDRMGTPGLWSIAVSEGQPEGAPELVRAGLAGLSDPMRLTDAGGLSYVVSIGMSQVYTARLDVAAGIVREPPVPLIERSVGLAVSPDWSADGGSLSYVIKDASGCVAGNTIHIRTLATGAEREVRADHGAAHFCRPRWSPDGRSFLANGKDDRGQQGLLRIDARTGAATLLARADQYITGQAWSPDGRTAYYCDGERFMRRRLDSGESREIGTAPGGPRANFAVSADGRWIAAFRGGNALEILPTAGGDPRDLVALQSGESMTFNSGTAWTPDGRHVLFTTSAPGSSDVTLWSVPAQGGEARRIDLTLPLIRDLRVHPDGQRIAFTAGEDRREIWSMEHVLAKAGRR